MRHAARAAFSPAHYARRHAVRRLSDIVISSAATPATDYASIAFRRYADAASLIEY